MNPALSNIEIQILENDHIRMISILAPSELWIIESLIRGMSSFGLRYCAEAIVVTQGHGNDAGVFFYPNDREDQEIHPDCVLVMAFDSEMEVNRIEFERFMLRFFEIMIQAHTIHAPEVLTESWWKEFLRYVELLKTRYSQE